MASLREGGIETKLRNNIKTIYEITTSYVRKYEEQFEELVAKEGLRQGGALSPILFVMIMDEVAKKNSRIKQTHVEYKCVKQLVLKT